MIKTTTQKREQENIDIEDFMRFFILNEIHLFDSTELFDGLLHFTSNEKYKISLSYKETWQMDNLIILISSVKNVYKEHSFNLSNNQLEKLKSNCQEKLNLSTDFPFLELSGFLGLLKINSQI